MLLPPPRAAAPDEMLTIRPLPEVRNSGAKARMVANGPRTFAVSTASIKSSSSASRSACSTIRVNPAEFTRMSARPNWSATGRCVVITEEARMDLFIALAAWSELAFGLVLFASLTVANEVGCLLGRRHAAQGSVPLEGVGVVVGGVLGLLAFVLALTLSFSSARFNDRRDGALAEANAI